MTHDLGGPARLPGTDLEFVDLDVVRRAGLGDPASLPMTVKVLLEGLVREAQVGRVRPEDVAALASWPKAQPAGAQLPFRPSRVLMQDYTGIPAAVDLAAMRAAMQRAGKDPARIEPLIPVDLVIDHSVQVDAFGTPIGYERNIEKEYERNIERYSLLRWSQQAFETFRVVPPGMGICHQVNLERLSRVVQIRATAGRRLAIPDTLVGTDSHTTMVNGLGVLGWGVGGIEAEAAMLDQPLYLPAPIIVGVRVSGQLPTGTTATDLVLTLTEVLRRKGVVNKFVEFCGAGLSGLAVADRATLSNMCPEYGATAALFPIDAQTLRYLALTGRERAHIDLVETYAKAQGLFRTDDSPMPAFDELVELDLGSIEPSVAGPKRPQDRVSLDRVWQSFTAAAPTTVAGTVATATRAGAVVDGDVVIAAITSCTNTSNPSVMVAAGLLARKAVERGLSVRPTVKTSLAPGSRVVTRYLEKAKLMEPLEKLGFYLVGYGCTTCIGNSGPLASAEVEGAVKDGDLNVVAVLSGNRNFEGRVHPLVRSSYLASPPLVVAYALAGTVHIDLQDQPLGTGRDGRPVFLHEIWPSPQEVADAVASSVDTSMFEAEYAKIFDGDEHWRAMPAPTGKLFPFDATSTYVQEPPFFQELGPAHDLADIVGARALAVLGDSVTTDHISPAGSIPAASPAGRYLIANGVAPADFNAYGTRRGNHEVLVRGTFANIRLRNGLVPGTEGYWTKHLPSGDKMTIFDAAIRYRDEQVPLVVLAGKEYGSGSSRDWAAKGPKLLGVRAVIAESYERIHRSNLVGMGILPLQYETGSSAAGLGLTGEETFTIRGLAGIAPHARIEVEATRADGTTIRFKTLARVDDPTDVEYMRNDGILTMVLRQQLR